jgi:hypothetical protein
MIETPFGAIVSTLDASPGRLAEEMLATGDIRSIPAATDPAFVLAAGDRRSEMSVASAIAGPFPIPIPPHARRARERETESLRPSPPCSMTREGEPHVGHPRAIGNPSRVQREGRR